MKSSKRPALVAITAAVGLVAVSACGGEAEQGSDAVSIAIGEPGAPLIPGATTEEYGIQVLESLWTGLVEYDQQGEIQYSGVAESIETQDNVHWTITLKDGWTFHDDSPVTAESFVAAWNYTAYSPNAQSGSNLLAGVEGYADLQAPLDEATGEPTGEPAAEELAGLDVLDDRTFTVTLSAPFAQFPLTLGGTVFFPLPDSFFADPEAAGQQPIGNGPFRAEGTWEPGTGITLTRYDDYAGQDPADVEAIEYRVYAEASTAYTDAQSGELDILPRVPADASGTAAEDFGDRYAETDSSAFTFLGVPVYEPRYADRRVRQALSMAIDRAAVARAIFGGSRRAADSLVAPVVDGYREGACTYCVLDVQRANSLLDEAGFDRGLPVELWFPAGTGNDALLEAVGNQLRQNLGVDFVLRGDLDPASYGPLLMEGGATGPFRFGWSMDYPSPQNYLEPLYSTQARPPAGTNVTFFTDPRFDELVARGNAAPGNAEAVAFYNQAEDVVLEEMPVIPLFFQVEQSVHSEDVSNVTLDIFGRVDTALVTMS